ncbi:MAG: SH3 domain-containing protein [Sarcina sp.]
MKKVKMLVISAVATVAVTASVASINKTDALADTLSDIPGHTQEHTEDLPPETLKDNISRSGNSENLNEAEERANISSDFYIYNMQGVQRVQYGTSGLGRPLYYYKIGNGSKTLFANFAIHGYEDSWAQDGYQLSRMAKQLIEKFNQKNKTSGLGDWSVIIIPTSNPDGILDGWTNNGPGRTQVSHKIDLNRSFPTYFKRESGSRNYTGSSPLIAPEAKSLANLVAKTSRESKDMVLLDVHGWLDMTIGDPQIGKYFINNLGLDRNSGYKGTGNGYFVSYGHAQGAEVSLIELPDTKSQSQFDSRDYVGKMYTAMNQVMNNGTGLTMMSKTGVVVNTSNLNIRSGATTEGDRLGSLSQGESVNIVGSINGWYKIHKPGIGYCYVSSDYVKITGEGSTNPGVTTGWQNIDGKTYYYDSQGKKTTGWLKLDGYWRYFNKDGVLQTGVQNIDGSMYHFDKNGAMYTGWLDYNGQTYYVTDDYKNLKGWHEFNGYWRHFNTNGQLLKGIQEIDGGVYNFDKNGAMYTGWLDYKGNSYYVTNKHENLKGWHFIDEASRYFNSKGQVANGWEKVDGYWRYFKNKGIHVTGVQEIDGGVYNFDKNGAMYTGWLDYKGNLYYVNDKHENLKGWHFIDGESRYFNSKGQIVSGWEKLDGYWRYFKNNGVPVTGIQNINGNIYNFDKNGAMYTGWLDYNGQTYYVTDEHENLKGWHELHDYWRYFNSKGQLLRGWHEIDGKMYHFDNNGALYV